MKTTINILILILLILTTGVQGQELCSLQATRGKSRYFRCHFTKQNKDVHFLELYGDIVKTAYDHGSFLAPQIRIGALKGVIEKKQRLLDSLAPDELKNYNQISKCVLRNYKNSVSRDFVQMSYAMADALHAQGITDFSRKDILEANMMVELSIFFDGLEYLMETKPGLAKRKLLAACPISMTKKVLSGLVKKVTKAFRRLKFGCTGIAAAGDYTSTKELILSRNFDTGLLGTFEKFPTIILHHPDHGYSYVGLGSAGIHFPGGISGFNEKGIVVSLHELQTTKYRTKYMRSEDIEEFGMAHTVVTTDVAPYMLNKLLMHAGTMKEAIRFIKERGHFGAWTVFIGDAKTGEIASVEFSGNKVRVARHIRNGAMPQSNHFINSTIRKYAFEYSYNKSLETRSRFDHVLKSLNRDRGHIDYQWMINMLSGHIDNLVGKRSFGRTTTKVYTAQSHVMLPSSQQIWFSIGEVYPTTSSTFVGFQVDFSKHTRNPFHFISITHAMTKELTEQENWSASLGHYVKAYLYSHHGELDNILKELDLAIDLARRDGVIEVPYYHIHGRYLIKKALEVHNGYPQYAIDLLHMAYDDYQMIIDAKYQNVQIHDYQLSLAYLWQARVVDLLNLLGESDKGISSRKEIARKSAKDLMFSLPNIYPSHHAFNKLRSAIYTPYNWKLAAEDDILMGTVE